MATTSACAVGSLSRVTRFWPVASSSPPSTTTAPNGPPPSSTLRTASSIAVASHPASTRAADPDTSAPSDTWSPTSRPPHPAAGDDGNPAGRAGANGNGDVNALVARWSRASRRGAPVVARWGGPRRQQVAVLAGGPPAQVRAGRPGDPHRRADLGSAEHGPRLPRGRRGGQVGR